MNAGNAAHRLLQDEFQIVYPLMLAESPLREGPARPDLIMATPTGLKIGEIKPANANGYAAGAAKMSAYTLAYRAAFPGRTIEPLDLMVPPEVTIFPNPQVPACPLQTLWVNPPLDGVYGYYCLPPFSQLVWRPECNCRQQVPVPVPRTQEQQQEERQRSRGPVPQPVPVPSPAPAPAPEPVPVPVPARRRMPSVDQVLKVLAIMGLSLLLALTVIAALADPEPATKLGLAGLSAAQVALLMTLLGVEKPPGEGGAPPSA
jgi:hypothetical protein